MRINGSHIRKEKVLNDQEYPDMCGPGLSKMLFSWFQILRKFHLGKKNRKVLNFVRLNLEIQLTIKIGGGTER